MKRAFFFALAVLGLAKTAHADDCPKIRPTDPGGYDGYVYDVAASSFDTAGGNVRVWYAPSGGQAPPLASTRADGVPDSVAKMGEVLEDAIAKYAALGFRPALRDGDYPACASNGGDGRVDLYLVSFKGADGLTVSERCTGTPLVCPGFLLVDAHMAAYSTFEEGAKTVAPHEYFHLVQNAYDSKLDRFWAEGTAQWATKQIHPDIMDLERFLPEFFKEVERPLDVPPSGVTSGYLYGSAAWPLYLSQRHDAGMVKSIFEKEGSGTTPTLAATDASLAAGGGSLAAEFATFALWNAATGARAGGDGYADAAKYPQVPMRDFADGEAKVDDTTAGLAARYYTLHDPAKRTVSLSADPSRLQGFVVPLVEGKAHVAAAVPLPAAVEGEAIVVLSGTSTKKTDVPYSLVAALSADADAGANPEAPPTEAKSGCALGGAPRAKGALLTTLALALAAGSRSRRARSRRRAGGR
jgi:hypothetical protein